MSGGGRHPVCRTIGSGGGGVAPRPSRNWRISYGRLLSHIIDVCLPPAAVVRRDLAWPARPTPCRLPNAGLQPRQLDFMPRILHLESKSQWNYLAFNFPFPIIAADVEPNMLLSSATN